MEHTCQFCNGTFSSSRPNVKYCSSAHRVAAFRQNKGIITKQPKEYDVCQREGCENEIPQERQSNAMYCSNACNQAVYNKKHAVELSKKRAEERERRRKLKEKAEKKKKIKQAEQKSKDLADEFVEELMKND